MGDADEGPASFAPLLSQELTAGTRSNYCYYMKPVELKVARIGNSRGVRIPAATLKRYHINERVVMEERSDGILLRPVGTSRPKLSWDETARAMAATVEDWSEWEKVDADGLETVPWEPTAAGRVAEPARDNEARSRPRKR
jgi:antitoxin MazE